jgi:hypothetical protein
MIGMRGGDEFDENVEEESDKEGGQGSDVGHGEQVSRIFSVQQSYPDLMMDKESRRDGTAGSFLWRRNGRGKVVKQTSAG